MIKFDKFKVFVAVFYSLVVFTSCIHICNGEEYQQQQNLQTGSNNNNNNGYSTPSTPPFTQYHHRNHQTRTGYPTESRTGIVVPLFFPMIVFVGVVLLIFFAVVGSAAVIGHASPIARHDVPTRFAFARDFSSSTALARDVLSGEQCVERISCELFRVAKGYKAQNWILRAIDLLPVKTNLTKRASRTLWRQSKISRNHRTGKTANGCVEFQCSSVNSFMQAAKKFAT